MEPGASSLHRQLVVWCPDLLERREHGREARAFARVLSAVEGFSPYVEALRPGVCALPTRGPSRYFGGDMALALLIAGALEHVDGVEDETSSRTPGNGQGQDQDQGLRHLRQVLVGVGVADGLFAASLAARSSLEDPERVPIVIAPGGTPAFLSSLPVEVLERPELADLLRRLGIRTLGALAELPAPHVLARFGTDGASCRAVAAGTRGELPGMRLSHCSSPTRAPAGAAGAGAAVGPDQRSRLAGFFGGTAAVDARAAEALATVQRLLHPEAVVRGRLQGGRGPGERARFVPWGEKEAGFAELAESATFPRKRPDDKSAGGGTASPWPGQLPSPSPVIVLRKPLTAELLDAAGRPVGVTGRGIASSSPSRLSVAGQPWAEVAGWAGPWPTDERWWSKRSRSRQARMQVVTSAGSAYLLARRRGWWVEGIYD